MNDVSGKIKLKTFQLDAQFVDRYDICADVVGTDVVNERKTVTKIIIHDHGCPNKRTIVQRNTGAIVCTALNKMHNFTVMNEIKQFLK